MTCPRCDAPATSKHRCRVAPVTVAALDAASRRCAGCGAVPASEWRRDDGRPLCGACASSEPSDEREPTL